MELLSRLYDDGFDAARLCCEVFERQIEFIKGGRFLLHRLKPKGYRRRIPGHHFHHHPELFVQLGGATAFDFPEERMRLKPDEVCIVPRYMPHMETPYNFKGAFHHFVVIPLFNNDIGIHLTEKNEWRLRAVKVLSFKSPWTKSVIDYLEQAYAVSQRKGGCSEEIAAGLMQAVFGILHEICSGEQIRMPKEVPYKVSQCKMLVQNNISNTDLTVKRLAEWITCAPDYLSHLFHQSTGEQLTIYINRKRIALAKELLATTSLNISETAWACGYSDPGYFTRIFRRLCMASPREYRKRLEG